MKAILICPEHRPTGGAFHRMKPLALMPVLGRSLLDHALNRLKKDGWQEVLVLASDRPEMIREATGKGQVWGLNVEVIATSHELSTELAEERYAHHMNGDGKTWVRVLDSLEVLPGRTFWQTNFATFKSLKDALQEPKLAAQMTMQEVFPDVWISTKARVSHLAEITGPVWVGPHAFIGAGAKIGPNSMIESGAFIDGGAIVEESWIGPATYVGATANIECSCAWGNGLLNWNDGSFLEVRDSFLLNDLTQRSASQKRASMFERALALLLMLATSPLALICLLRSCLSGEEALAERRVLLPPPQRVDAYARTYALLRLQGTTGLLQRWPELWRVVRGDMALVGNRPLSPEETTALRGPMAHLWMESPAGVFSLADALGADGDSIRESLAHSAYFTARRSLSLRLRILIKCLLPFLTFGKPTENLTLTPLANPV